MPIAVQHAYVLSDASALSSYQQQHHTYHASSSPPLPHYHQQQSHLAHPHHPRVPIPMPASNQSGSESPQANKRKRSRAGCYTCRRRKVSWRRPCGVRAAASPAGSDMRYLTRNPAEGMRQRQTRLWIMVCACIPPFVRSSLTPFAAPDSASHASSPSSTATPKASSYLAPSPTAAPKSSVSGTASQRSAPVADTHSKGRCLPVPRAEYDVRWWLATPHSLGDTGRVILFRTERPCQLDTTSPCRWTKEERWNHGGHRR